jgi:hypothetical protein
MIRSVRNTCCGPLAVNRLGCVLGDSHMACLRLAWEGMKSDVSGLSLDMFGCHGAGLRDTMLDSGRLVPTSKTTRAAFEIYGGRADIDLAAYDFFVVVGCGMSIFSALSVYYSNSFLELPSMDSHLKVDWPEEGKALISKACFAQAMKDTLARSIALHVACLLQQAGPAPVLISIQPRPCVTSLKQPGKYPAFRTAIRDGNAALLSEMFSRSCEDVCGGDFGVLHQPADTIEKNIFTAPEFTSGAVRLAKNMDLSQPDHDTLHANEIYGRRIIRQIQTRIA